MKRIGLLILFFVVMFMHGSGCNQVNVGKADRTYQSLMQIGEAYQAATTKLGRAPASVAELSPYLEPYGEPAEILHSDNDKEGFVILWDVDCRQLPYPVIAYEKTGKNGKRYVLLVRHVVQMSDEELKQAPFPPGNKAPL